ncbi:MAG: bifunctional precorrin-2 dehydrogenase/sirohydrochlorin ferrochelatase [Gemmatimonadota bacterium]|jgi:precorrin-2 dehydrogenase/sirohydrochlorin ferrochelatase
MKYLPVGLDVRGRICIVVGGGQIGTRKTNNLLRAGAAVTVISPEASTEVAELAETGRIRWISRGYQEGDSADAFLTVAATSRDDLNGQVVRDAAENGSLVCDASSQTRSEVIFGALHAEEGVTVAVFTDGRDPGLARRTRDRIADLNRQWRGS